MSMQFVDFWAGYENEDHWFLEQFRKKQTEGTLYSVYGSNPETSDGAYNFSKPRVFFNVEPDHRNPYKERLKSADYSFSYHYGDGRSNPELKEYFPSKHLRILNFVANLGPKKVKREIREKNNSKKAHTGEDKDVAMVYSNRREHRREIFNIFRKELDVDSAGPFLNNMENNWTVPKGRGYLIDFMSNYKFYLAIENSRHRGYLTEKLYNALLADTIPIYWGDPDVANVFNTEAYIDISDFSSIKNVLKKMKSLSPKEEKKYLNAPIADEDHKLFNFKRFISKIEEI